MAGTCRFYRGVAPAALNLVDDFQSPRSRTGLLNIAASRLVEWFSLESTEKLAKKTRSSLFVLQVTPSLINMAGD